MLLAIVAIANSHWREALQLLACVLATPTGLFNHCLLQCRVGVVMGGAGGWLERRGSTPVGRSDARDKLRHSQQLLHTVYVYLVSATRSNVFPLGLGLKEITWRWILPC